MKSFQYPLHFSIWAMKKKTKINYRFRGGQSTGWGEKMADIAILKWE